MRIRSVSVNNRRKVFEAAVDRRVLPLPFHKADPAPTRADPVVDATVDRELGREAFTYTLRSGRQGTVHVDQLLDYNQDPEYMRQALLYRLTLVAQQRIAKCPLSKREIVRRLGTSATQLYRILDQTNTGKSLDQLLMLLHVMDCEVDFVVRTKSA